jgi:protein SCO1/2
MKSSAIARARVTPAARAIVTMLAAALVGASLTACGSGSAAERPGNDQGYRGVVLETPLAKPDFVLTDTKGEPFDFRKETDGSLTLLFFGYTNCPDVCPVHLGNIHTVLEQMPYDVRSRTRVVFVTTDPERDTPGKLRAFLDNFDKSYIGLRGTLAEVNQIQAELHLPPAVASAPHGDKGSYDVGHAAQVIAFSPADNMAHLVYPFGTRQQDWADDLPKLMTDKWTARGSGS